MHLKRRFIAWTLAVTGLIGGTALAQDNWPEKPIRVVVPYTPGGGTDTITRHLADKLVADNKWTLLVDNKPGAGGNVGMDIVAKSKPDGYIFGMGQTANLAINPALLPKMPFDPSKDFVPVALVAEQPTVLVVRTDAPWKNLAELVQAAKAKPGQIKQALASTGTVGHLAGEMLAVKAGFQVLNVPYKGAAPAITDLLGGQTDFMFATPQAVLSLIKGGKLRALAVTSLRRLSILAEVPTVDEVGYKNFEAVDWKMVVAPTGTPSEVVRRLNTAIEKALAHSSLQVQLAAEGSSPLGGSPDKATQYLRSEQNEWATLIRTAKITLD